jgi:hypothetical protein
MSKPAGTPTAPTGATHAPAWAYAWWVVVGALFGFGLFGILSVGIVFLLAATVLAVVGLSRPGLRRGAVALVAGLAAPTAGIAWLNRHGPGTYCRVTSDGGQACEGQWSPWPFVAVAVVLVVAAVVLARSARGS